MKFLLIAILLTCSSLAGALEDPNSMEIGERLQDIIRQFNSDDLIRAESQMKYLKIEKRLEAYYITCFTEEGLLGLPAGLDENREQKCEPLPICQDGQSAYRSTNTGSTIWDFGPHCRSEIAPSS